MEKLGLQFEVLRDSGNEVAATFGLRWTLPDDLRRLYVSFGLEIPGGNGDDSWTLALPASFIVDRNGMIYYARTDPDYTCRPEPEETIAVLNDME